MGSAGCISVYILVIGFEKDRDIHMCYISSIVVKSMPTRVYIIVGLKKDYPKVNWI